jgi:hypothetical protein
VCREGQGIEKVLRQRCPKIIGKGEGGVDNGGCIVEKADAINLTGMMGDSNMRDGW